MPALSQEHLKVTGRLAVLEGPVELALKEEAVAAVAVEVLVEVPSTLRSPETSTWTPAATSRPMAVTGATVETVEQAVPMSPLAVAAVAVVALAVLVREVWCEYASEGLMFRAH